MTILLRQKSLPQVVRQIVQRDNGAWFDPEDMSTMFQDAAGTTPVTEMEQPVGLWLDKSQGMELGPVTNYDFSTGFSGWIYQDSNEWVVSGGALTYNPIGGTLRRIFNNLLTVGKVYEVSIESTVLPTNGWIISIGSGSVFSNKNSTSIKVTGCCTGNGFLYIQAATATTGTIDNISVRELKGNHATQSVTASRPTLSARYNLLLNSATLSTQSVTTGATQYTLSFTGTGSVTLSGTATGTLNGTGVNNRVNLPFTATAGTLTLTVSGSVTLAMLAFGTLTTYQDITTAKSYDSVAWPKYLRGDGIDDFYNLPFLNLYGSGSCSIVAAHDAISQATDTYIISERSTTDADPKYFPSRQLANGGNMDSYIVSDEGTVRLDTIGSAFSGAKLAAIRSVVDSGNNIKLFKDGAVVADDNYKRAGTLTLNNTTIGASVSTTRSNYANMRLYGLIITKSALSDTDRKRCEQYQARKLSKLGVALA